MKELGLSSLFSDGMIIQRDAVYPVYSDKKLTVLFLGKTYESQSFKDKWLLTLEPIKAGGPFTMEISCKGKSFTIKDVYCGDVWLCAGQSNMEMTMERLHDDFSEEWQSAQFPVIRHFRVPCEWDFSAPRCELTGGTWKQASKETLQDFSATAWFFAKNLYEKYKNAEGICVPIGLVNTAWGGTPVEAWMSEEALAGFPKILSDGKQYANEAKRNEITNANAYAILEWENNVKNEDAGFPLNWQDPKTDISCWGKMILPGNFADAETANKEDLKNFCGSIWLAKDVEISAPLANSGAKVWLGTIVDADTVYINGKEIGNTGYRYPPRKYAVPQGLLKEGKNRIVIRVICNNGQGAVTTGNPFCIFTENESLELAGTWKYNIGSAASIRPSEFFFQWQPLGNFNAMIAPVLKYPLKGVIWYQGESNESRSHEYCALFKTMIQDWRKKNANENLPFFFVQLPVFLAESENCETHNWALMREAQSSALSLANTNMACALELGEWNDIHPIDKKGVGYRLFLAAEKFLFGTENTSPGPMVKKYEIKNGKLYVYFDNCGKGLLVKEKETNILSIINDEGQTNLSAQIESAHCISIDISAVKKPKKVLYAWANNPKYRALFNSEGLPCIPFRIEIKE